MNNALGPQALETRPDTSKPLLCPPSALWGHGKTCMRPPREVLWGSSKRPSPLSPGWVSSQMSAVGFYIRSLMHFQSRRISLPCFDSLALVEIQLNFSKTRALKLNLHSVYTFFFP